MEESKEFTAGRLDGFIDAVITMFIQGYADVETSVSVLIDYDIPLDDVWDFIERLAPTFDEEDFGALKEEIKSRVSYELWPKCW